MDGEATTLEWAVEVATDTYDEQFSALDLRFFGASLTITLAIGLIILLIVGSICACTLYRPCCKKEEDYQLVVIKYEETVSQPSSPISPESIYKNNNYKFEV
ncbi:hypothetical protein PMAYCL1PPCAC_08244 [Pristionchus mayeri]|uniref:Uncharacterized protein n=1 Tax=Pristionchus mayeri TaxID=1317129 RepID=A0AAN4ZDN1_9BILA|nr:hypothetical protein PMAYCL1PPCAC_08244 [Pristionchus mayeri]